MVYFGHFLKVAEVAHFWTKKLCIDFGKKRVGLRVGRFCNETLLVALRLIKIVVGGDRADSRFVYGGSCVCSLQKNERLAKLAPRQGDQIVRIFAQWAIVYFGPNYRSITHFWAALFHG
jgi:hypothetical protein